MARRAIRKTDYGTILLHWTLVALLAVAVATGLRIALDSPDRLPWLQALDFLLPQSIVWTAHIPAGTALFALAISYSIYMAKTGLSRRIRPDLLRLKGIVGGAQARYGALNILLYWMLFTALAIQLVTGTMLYIGHGGWPAELHLMATWAIIGYVPAHIAVHYGVGGKSQLLRILNPGRLAPPAPAFDPFDLIAAQTVSQDPALAVSAPDGTQAVGGARRVAPEKPSRTGGKRPMRGGQVLRAHPLPTAIAGGLGFLVFLLSLDSATRETLVIPQIASEEKPVIDGDISDTVWRVAQAIKVPTQQGANLDGAGESTVEIRAVHDGTYAYFSFVWQDPTRSLKHVPLVKTETGWRVLQEGFDRDDATGLFEDKLAVLFIGKYVLIPGDRTFHAGHQPLGDKPATLSGRGLHYTTDGGYADMWQWHAANAGMVGWIDDAHFGPPATPTAAQTQGVVAYKGGFAPDPGTASHALNFDQRGPGGYDNPITPKRLPKNWQKAWKALGKVDLNADIGDGAESIWWLTDAESEPYTAELDASIPIGCVIPGVLISGSYSGDRADVHGAARWAAGRWSLEAVRRLDTASKYDTPIATGTYMRVAVFDHTQSRHTRHIRPIRLEVNRCEKVAECISTIRSLQLSGAKSFSTQR